MPSIGFERQGPPAAASWSRPAAVGTAAGAAARPSRRVLLTFAAVLVTYATALAVWFGPRFPSSPAMARRYHVAARRERAFAKSIRHNDRRRDPADGANLNGTGDERPRGHPPHHLEAGGDEQQKRGARKLAIPTPSAAEAAGTAGTAAVVQSFHVPHFIDHYAYQKWQTTEFECVPDFDVEVPITRNKVDFERWLQLERPFFGCEFVNRTHCRYKGDCSTYQVAYNSSVHAGSLGECGVRGPNTLEVRPGRVPCDNRTFVPLKAPQGAFFGHFIDNVLPKLVRVLLRGEKRILVYMEPDYYSANTIKLAKRMGVEIAFDFPLSPCFSKVVYACHTVSFDPLAARAMSHFLRLAYAPPSTTTPFHDRDEERREARRRAGGLQVVHRYDLAHNVTTHDAYPLVGRNNNKRATRVYASRLSGTKNGRRMANEAEFARVLERELGFVTFRGGESLSTWAEAMRDAEIVVGPHGTALAHMLWLDPANAPIVLELDGFNKFAVFWVIARSLGAKYAWMGFDESHGVVIRDAVRFIRELLDPSLIGRPDPPTVNPTRGVGGDSAASAEPPSGSSADDDIGDDLDDVMPSTTTHAPTHQKNKKKKKVN